MIPQGRLSTVPVLGSYLPPEYTYTHPITTYERGPIAIEDTSEGLLYQNWMMTWENDEFTLTPETTGPPVVNVLTVLDVKYASFTFDQAGRVTITYMTSVSSFMYWYDTALGHTVTTDLSSDVLTPSVYLDDKRPTQNTTNDMLLWYTKANGGTYDLFMSIQRDRFLTEYLMASGLDNYYITRLGMTSELRIQIELRRN